MLLDAFCHIHPRRFLERMAAVAPDAAASARMLYGVDALHDMDARLRTMDAVGVPYRQIICLSGPPIEALARPEQAVALAQLANDEMAALVAQHPTRFRGFVASLPMHAGEAMLEEARRAVTQLGACGVQVHSHVNGLPLTAPATIDIFGCMADLDRPIWLHPERDQQQPDYPGLERSEFEAWFALGWPHATSVAMAHIVFEGIFARFPGVKIIAHQMGGTVPYLAGRIATTWERLGARTPDRPYRALRASMTEAPVDSFRRFYADTTGAGSSAALACCVEFFGPERVLFATDMPFGPRQGEGYIRQAIDAVDGLGLTAEQRSGIYHRNAERLLGLPLST